MVTGLAGWLGIGSVAGRPDYGRAVKAIRTVVAAAAAFLLPALPAHAVDPDAVKEMYLKGEHTQVAALCRTNADEVAKHEFADRIFYYCGQSKMAIYEKEGQATDLIEAIDDLERSTYLYYLPSTAFALGKARIASLSQMTDLLEIQAVQKQAISEMWEAMLKRHAQEGFEPTLLSDTLLSWSIAYYDSVIDRIILEDEATARWLSARLRMLADRYSTVDPSKGESPTRQTNLKTISGWMHELYESTYFDNNVTVGMFKFRGERRMEQYDQTVATEAKFLEGLGYYDQGLARAKSPKAKSVLKERISYLTSLYNSEDKAKKILYYEVGFFHANNALKLLLASSATTYPFEPAASKLVADLQVNYGRNLSGLLYFLWEKEDYKAVVSLRDAFSVIFDWNTKLDDLLRIADAASRMARNEFRKPGRERDMANYSTYKEICLTAASQAFNYALTKVRGDREGNLQNFCATLDAYSAFLSGFGEIAEASNLTDEYGGPCREKQTGAIVSPAGGDRG